MAEKEPVALYNELRRYQGTKTVEHFVLPGERRGFMEVVPRTDLGFVTVAGRFGRPCTQKVLDEAVRRVDPDFQGGRDYQFPVIWSMDGLPLEASESLQLQVTGEAVQRVLKESDWDAKSVKLVAAASSCPPERYAEDYASYLRKNSK